MDSDGPEYEHFSDMPAGTQTSTYTMHKPMKNNKHACVYIMFMKYIVHGSRNQNW